MTGSNHPSPTTGDEGWIRSVLRQHEGPLLAYALRLCRGDLERARDLVQDCFLRLVKADRAEIGERTAVWLFHVCRNRALDLQEKDRPMLALDTTEPPPDPRNASPVEHLAARDEASHLNALVERLPARERELVRLKFEHGLSYAEMGTITGLTATNVGFLLHKALRALRERLPAEEVFIRKECAS
ncbi:MAG: sigma-70 family RNA polymerase sigma factor [Planctomycetota bacterium]